MGTASIALVYPIRRFHPARKTRSNSLELMEFLSSRWLLGQARERDRERKANDRLEFLGQGIYDKLLFLDESGPAGKAGLCG